VEKRYKNDKSATVKLSKNEWEKLKKPSRIQCELDKGEDELEKGKELKPSCTQCGKKYLYEIEIGKFEKFPKK